jgi:hypothetical protein
MSTQPIQPTTKTQTFIQRHKVKLSGIAVLATMGVALAFKAAMDSRYPFSDEEHILDGYYNPRQDKYHLAVKKSAFKDTEAVLDAIQAAIQEHKKS